MLVECCPFLGNTVQICSVGPFSFYVLINYQFINSANPSVRASACGLAGKLITVPGLKETWKGGDPGNIPSSGRALERWRGHSCQRASE